jgi:hypothetical protein
MKLSDAIRKGAKLNNKTTKAYKDSNGTCAFGAALEGLEYDLVNKSDTILTFLCHSAWPESLNIVTHPIYKNNCCLFIAITELNDIHNWTREQIADWIDSLTAKKTVVEKEEIKEGAKKEEMAGV